MDHRLRWVHGLTRRRPAQHAENWLRYDNKLAANLGKYTLAFQLEIHPYVVTLEPVEARPKEVSPKSFWTPKPVYPYYSRRFYGSGTGKFQVIFGSKDGRPIQVVRVKSSGRDVLDANTVLFVLNHWYAPVGMSGKAIVTKTIEYRLSY